MMESANIAAAKSSAIWIALIVLEKQKPKRKNEPQANERKTDARTHIFVSWLRTRTVTNYHSIFDICFYAHRQRDKIQCVETQTFADFEFQIENKNTTTLSSSPFQIHCCNFPCTNFSAYH